MSAPAQALPDPRTEPTIDLWPTAARILGVGRNAIYAAAAAGEVPTIRIGHRIRVPTAALLRQLGLDDAARDSAGPAADPALALLTLAPERPGENDRGLPA